MSFAKRKQNGDDSLDFGIHRNTWCAYLLEPQHLNFTLNCTNEAGNTYFEVLSFPFQLHLPGKFENAGPRVCSKTEEVQLTVREFMKHTEGDDSINFKIVSI